MHAPKKLNLRFALILVLSLVVAGVAIHFTHRYQVRRNAHHLLAEATRLEEAGEPRQAIDCLEQYLLFVPADTAARAQYALLVNALAVKPKEKMHAYLALNEALRRDPSRQDLRRAIVPLGIALGDFSLVRSELEELLKAAPEDPELLRYQARVETAGGKFELAEQSYRKAIQATPADPDLSMELAMLLRGSLNSPLLADLEVDRLLRAGGDSPPVRLAAAGYYFHWGHIEKASAAMTAPAGGICSEEAEALLLATEIDLARKQPESARRHLDRGAARYPKDARFPSGIARLELTAGRRDAALAIALPLTADSNLDLEQIWELGNILVDLGETARVEELLGRLAQKAPTSAVEFLRGRLLMRKGTWGEARLKFETAINQPRVTPDLARNAHLCSAECHERLGNPDAQAAACRKAIDLDPQWLPARQKLAEALVKLGRTEEAILEHRLIADRSPAARIEAARLSIVRNLRLPATDRRWGEVENLLRDMPESHRVDAEMLKAEMLFAQDRADEARRLVEAERDRDSKQAGPWLFLVGIAERGPDPKAARPVIDEAEKAAGPRADWTIARARLWLKTGGADAAARIAALESEAAKLPESARDRALLGIGEYLVAAGDTAGAERVWVQIAGVRPNDADIQLRLFGLAVQKGDEARAHAILANLVRIEGPDGPLAAFAQATIHADRARKGDRSAIAAARQSVARASAARPSWAAAALLEAELFELEGNRAGAIEKYEKAVASGQAPMIAVRRLVQHLAAQGRYAEAQAALAKLGEGDDGVTRASAQLTLLSASRMDTQEAATTRKQGLDAARKTVADGSTDYRDHFWLGQMALLANEHAEAEKAFRRARELKDTAPETWVALILLLSRTDAKQAEAELDAARAKIAGDQLPAVLAVCYEALGRVKEAGEQYRGLAAGRPDDATALRDQAAFQLRTNDAAAAEQTLRRLLALGPKLTPELAAWGRRALALTLASRGGFDRFNEADTLTAAGTELEDRWTRALVLASQSGRRQESIDLIRKAPSSAPPHARFLLAKLYDRDGQWLNAKAELAQLVRSDPRNPAYLAYFARVLIRQGQPGEAGPLVERLVRIAGTTFETVDLQARLLISRKQLPEAAKLVQDFVASKGPDATLAAAALLDSLGLQAEAEQLYRTHIRESKDPRAPLSLAGFLARHRRLPEALTLCEAAWKTCPPEPVAHMCVAALRVGKGSEADARRVEGWIDESISRNPKLFTLLILKADVMQFRGGFAEAADLYRQVLRQNPKDVIALNNLAFLVAVQDGKPAEAITLINAALDGTGPHAELLDTRAIVLTRAGRTDEAIADLHRAIADSPSPVKQFHLAQAHLGAGRKAEAAGAFRDATAAGLKLEDLHQLERSDWDRLNREVASQGGRE